MSLIVNIGPQGKYAMQWSYLIKILSVAKCFKWVNVRVCEGELSQILLAFGEKIPAHA